MNDVRGPAGERQQGIAAAITEVTERASVLVREEIELAKTEITEKATRLAKGAVVGIVAGVFFLTALFFVLVGCAWLLYFELPIGNDFTYFWGFFAMALILVILGVIAGLLAARAVKSGSPPVPAMAIEEARKIRETVSTGSEQATARDHNASAGSAAQAMGAAQAGGAAQAMAHSVGGEASAAAAAPPAPPALEEESAHSGLGREADSGTTLGS